EPRHGDACLEGGPDDAGPWVADAGQSRVADQGNPHPRPQAGQHFGRPLGFVVLVVADEPSRDPMALQQDTSPPRVLAKDELRLGQLAQHAERDVLEVADRSRADGERHQAASTAENATIAAPIMPAEVPSSARTTRTSSRIG